MTHLFCSLMMMIYWYTQKDPLIHLWGIKVMTDARRKERWGCVLGRKRTLAQHTKRSTRILEKAVPDTWKSCLQCSGHTLSLPAHSIQSTTTSSYAVRPWPPSEHLKLETQSARVNLHSLAFVSSQCTVSERWTHFVTQLLRERLCVCVFGWLSGCFGFLPAFNLLFFSLFITHTDRDPFASY